MIEKNLILILMVLILILMVGMAALMFLVFKLLLQKPVGIAEDTSKNLSNVITKISNEKVYESFLCPNHPTNETSGTCLICEEAFCSQCLVEHESMNFCKEHYRLFVQNKWTHISDIKTTPDSPEEALYVYHFKRHLWRELKSPSYIVTHYKINIENDFIESFVQLYVLEDKAISLKIQLDNKKGQD